MLLTLPSTPTHSHALPCTPMHSHVLLTLVLSTLSVQEVEVVVANEKEKMETFVSEQPWTTSSGGQQRKRSTADTVATAHAVRRAARKLNLARMQRLKAAARCVYPTLSWNVLFRALTTTQYLSSHRCVYPLEPSQPHALLSQVHVPCRALTAARSPLTGVYPLEPSQPHALLSQARVPYHLRALHLLL